MGCGCTKADQVSSHDQGKLLATMVPVWVPQADGTRPVQYPTTVIAALQLTARAFGRPRHQNAIYQNYSRQSPPVRQPHRDPTVGAYRHPYALYHKQFSRQSEQLVRPVVLKF